MLVRLGTEQIGKKIGQFLEQVMNSGMLGDRTLIGRLRVRGAAAGVDPLLLRLRATHLLETADLTPPGLPPGAILHIRRLADPLPGRLNLDAPQLAPDRAWQAALTGQLGTLAAQAERPLHQAVSAGAQAVLFADQAEMLACLALDWLAGQLLNRWWWREVVRNQPLEPAVVGAWLSALDAIPTALAHLNRRSAAVAFLRRLNDEDVARLLTGLVERHRLRALSETVAASRPGAAGFARSIEQPEAGAIERAAGSARADEATGETGVAAEGMSGMRAAGPAAAPWQRLVPADSANLSQPRQLLLGVGLALVYAPGAVRGAAFARQALRWAEGRPAARTAAPPAPPEVPPMREDAPGRATPAGQPRLDEQAGGAYRDEAQPGAPQPEQIPRGDAAQMRATSEAAAVAERSGALRPGTAAGDRPLPAEEASQAVATGGAAAAGEAQASAAAGAAPAQPAATEDAALDVVEVRTGYAGLFYLMNAALGLGFYADFTQPDAEGELALSPWAFLALIGRALIGDELEADPVWGLLARLAGTENDDTGWADRFAIEFIPPDGLSLAEWVERTAGEVYEWIAARFAEPLAGRAALAAIAFARAGRVRVAAGRLDIVLWLDDLDVRVRLAGLDRNPGWVPAAGRTIALHYD